MLASQWTYFSIPQVK